MINKNGLEKGIELHRKWRLGEVGGVRFDGRGADFSGANLEGVNFREANLEGVNFSGANLGGAYFKEANLEGVNFREANLEGAYFKESDLRGADFRGADFKGAFLEGAIFMEAFRGADLRGVHFDLEMEEGLLGRIKLEIDRDKSKLEMGTWDCGTSRCLAGWAVFLGKSGEELKDKFGFEIAGLKLLGREAHSYFFRTNEEVLEYLRGVV